VIRRVALVLASLSFSVSAQLGSQPAQAETGVSAEWDVRTQLTALATAVRDTEAILRRADIKVLQENGAPETYIKQLRSAQSSMQQLVTATATLAGDPERLSAALEAYFQMERVELLLDSLRDGIRKYESPDLADMLNQTFSRNAVHRGRLRQHIRDVADLREQEFQIANEEAQRCRGTLTKQSGTSSDRKTSSVGQKPSPTGRNTTSQGPAQSPSRK